MNKILKKYRKRNIRDNFKQFLSVIFIVLLSTMLLSGFITNVFTLKSTINSYFETTNLADIWVNTDNVSQQDEDFLKLNNLEYDKRLYFESTSEIKTLKLQNSAKFYIYKGEVSNPYIETGKWGCVIDKNVARNHNIRAGFDEISFSYSFEFNGQEYDFDFNQRLTGTMSLDESADSYSSWAIFIEEEVFIQSLKSQLAEEIEGFNEHDFEGLHYNQILIKTDNIQETSNIIYNYYENSTTSSKLLYLFDRSSIESVRLLEDEVKQAEKMIYVFPVIFLIVSVLIILTTIDQLVIRERKRIGILKACGVQNKKILRHYSHYGSILCFFGAVAGSLLGVFIIPEIMFAKYDNIYSIPEDLIQLNVPYLWICLMIISIVLLGYVVSFLRCYKILKANPIECLRNNFSGYAKKRKKKKCRFKKMPISFRMAVRNISMKPIRTLMASIGIAGCVSLLFAGFGMGDTIDKSLHNDLKNVFNYDVSSTYKSDDFIEKVENDSRTAYFEEYSKVLVNAKHNDSSENVYIYQINNNSKISSICLDSGDVCVSGSVAEDLGVSVGDEITVHVVDTNITIKVSMIVETTLMNAIYVCDDLNFSEFLVTKGVFVQCVGDDLEYADFLNSINGTNTALTNSQELDIAKERVLSISTMTTTIKVFAVLLSIIVLLNLIILIIKERGTEIATLKVMGQNSWQVSISVFLEVILISILGTIIGLCLGYPLMLLILSINKINIINYIFTISFLSVFSTIFIVWFTIIVVLFICYFNVRKVNMCESLKFVE